MYNRADSEMPANKNVTFHRGTVDRENRERLLGQRGCVVWFTGLSGSGKSTIAREVETLLAAAGRLVYVLDGDNVRHGLNSDLGFSDADRQENIRRIAEVAALFVDAGIIVLTAFISPFVDDRERARAIIGPDRFVEVFVDTPLATCERRDPKGLYEKARSGAIAEFTGISSPYEPPLAPALVLQTTELGIRECAQRVQAELQHRELLTAVGNLSERT